MKRHRIRPGHLKAALQQQQSNVNALAGAVIAAEIVCLQRGGEISPEEAAKALHFDMVDYWSLCSRLDLQAKAHIARGIPPQLLAT